MIIVKKTEEAKCTIYETISPVNNAKRTPLFTIVVPPQAIVYSILDDALEDRPVEIIVRYEQASKGGVTTAQGSWSLQTFTDFVDGTKLFTDTALPFIKTGKFEAEAKITETTYAWSKFFKREAPGGYLRSRESKPLQWVRFEILGLRSEYVRWTPDMLDPVIELRDEIIRQREDFLQQMRAVKNDLRG